MVTQPILRVATKLVPASTTLIQPLGRRAAAITRTLHNKRLPLAMAVTTALLSISSNVATAQSMIRIGIVDIRRHAGTSAASAATAALDRNSQVGPLAMPALVAILAGASNTKADKSPPSSDSAINAAAFATIGDHENDCPHALTAANKSIDSLATAQAAGAPVNDALVAAYSFMLRCMHRTESLERAQQIANHLRTLGADPPPDVDDSVWTRYPAIDATSNRFINELTVQAPKGANVWIDHAFVGTAPLRLNLSEGEHLVAAAHKGTAGVVRITITGRVPQSIKLELTPFRSARNTAIVGWITALRRRHASPTPYELAQIGYLVGARVLFVLSAADTASATRVQAWNILPGEAEAIPIGTGSIDQLDDLVTLSIAAVRRRATAITSVQPSPPARTSTTANVASSTKPWWIYAAMASAIAVGTGVVLVTNFPRDTQVIRFVPP